MVYKKGTLLIPTGPSHHLHIVMNDPVFSPEHGDERALIVNISTVYPDRHYDDACLLNAGCHPFITRQSYVYYKCAVISEAPRLTAAIEAGNIVAKPAVNDEVFNLVRLGFDNSRFVLPKIRRFLKYHQI